MAEIEWTEGERAAMKVLDLAHTQQEHRDKPVAECPICQTEAGLTPTFNGKPLSDQQYCYDFPRFVIHRPGCPRYTGGICTPRPTPTEPYTEEEARVVKEHDDLVAAFPEHPNMKVGETRVLPGLPDSTFYRIPDARGMTRDPSKNEGN